MLSKCTKEGRKHKHMTLVNDQLDAQISNTFITILYMFLAISCSSSGGQIVLTQHLVSSLSVSDRPVHRLSYTAVLRLPGRMEFHLYGIYLYSVTVRQQVPNYRILVAH